MKGLLCWLLFILHCFTASNLSARQIALSFDDAPRPDSICLSASVRRQSLLQQLAQHSNAPAIFMVTTQHLQQQNELALKSFVDAGHYLGNHSHSHRHPAELGLSGYLADVAKANELLSAYPAYQKFYRFPFLDEGRDTSMRDGLREGLSLLGLQQAYVTIDNYDWYMDHLLQRLLQVNRPISAEALGQVYVSEIMASIAFYDAVAQRYLGRSPAHVLLLHENDIAALFLGDLVKALHNDGWEIISPLQAYQDAIGQIQPETLFNNQGRVAALAHLAGASKRDLVPENEEESYLDQVFAVEALALKKNDTAALSLQLLCQQLRQTMPVL